jgi:purine-binding chemotaxis protein CheW
MSTRKYAVFMINEEEFGIEIERISIIERMLEIYKIPNTPEYVEGLTNLRGKVLTVFNLRKRFHLPCPEFTDDTKVIIASAQDSVIGLIVDGVREIVKAEEDQFEPMPKALSGIRDKFLKGTVKLGDRLILILDVDKVITEEDIPDEKPSKRTKPAEAKG